MMSSRVVLCMSVCVYGRRSRERQGGAAQVPKREGKALVLRLGYESACYSIFFYFNFV